MPGASDAPPQLPPPSLAPWFDADSVGIPCYGGLPGAVVRVIELWKASGAVRELGYSYAASDGRAVVSGLDLAGVNVTMLAADQEVFGATGSHGLESHAVTDAPEWSELAAPECFDGAIGIRVHGATQGSEVSVISLATGNVLGSAAAGGPTVEVDLDPGVELREGQEIVLRQAFRTGPANDGAPIVVRAPDSAPLPRVAPVFAGSPYVYAEGLLPGTTVALAVEKVAQFADVLVSVVLTVEIEHLRPATFSPWISHRLDLVAGDQLTVRIRWDSGLEQEVTTTVLAVPADARKPYIVPNLFDGGHAVRVESVHGAVVSLWRRQGGNQDDLFVGMAMVTDPSGSVVVPCIRLGEDWVVFAAQELVPGAAVVSDDIVVMPQQAPAVPRILPPFSPTSDEVWVSSVTPGATVALRRASGPFVGWAVSADPMTRIPVVPPGGPLIATSSLWDLDESSPPASPVPDPGDPGPYAVRSAEIDLQAGTVMGILYYPWEEDEVAGAPPPGPLPLVVIAHGNPPDSLDGTSRPQDSYLGYEWLGAHLAGHGFAVLSLSSGSDAAVGTSDVQSAATLLRDGVTALPDGLESSLLGSPLVLIGHSVGGDAVAGAVLTPPAPPGVVAVVLIAMQHYPSSYSSVRKELGVPLAVVSGRLDYARRCMEFIQWGVRPSIGILFETASHVQFNSVWDYFVNGDDENPGHGSGADNDPAGHADGELVRPIVRDGLTAWLRDLLTHDGGSTWLRGWCQPQSFGALTVYMQVLPSTGPEWRDQSSDGVLPGGPVVVDYFPDGYGASLVAAIDTFLFPGGKVPGGPWPTSNDLDGEVLVGVVPPAESAIVAVRGGGYDTGPGGGVDSFGVTMATSLGAYQQGVSLASTQFDATDLLSFRVVVNEDLWFLPSVAPMGAVVRASLAGATVAVSFAALRGFPHQLPFEDQEGVGIIIPDVLPVRSVFVPLDALLAAAGPAAAPTDLEEVGIGEWSRAGVAWIADPEFSRE